MGCHEPFDDDRFEIGAHVRPRITDQFKKPAACDTLTHSWQVTAAESVRETTDRNQIGGRINQVLLPGFGQPPFEMLRVKPWALRPESSINPLKQARAPVGV